MNLHARYAVLALVFVLSTVFFWQALNSYLIPSKAQQASNFRVFVSDKNIECNTDPNALCLVHIFGASQPGEGVSAVSGAFQHDAGLTFEGYTLDGFCGQASFKLDSLLDMKNPGGAVTFSMGALRADAQLESGNKCITTVGFKPTNIQNGATASFNLAPDARWQAVGSVSLVPSVDSEVIQIRFSPNAPIPTIILTPPPAPGGPGVPPPAGSCETYSQGDCNCDGTVNLPDWEILRSSVRQEGQACDVNSDGVINSTDLAIWQSNYK